MLIDSWQTYLMDLKYKILAGEDKKSFLGNIKEYKVKEQLVDESNCLVNCEI